MKRLCLTLGIVAALIGLAYTPVMAQEEGEGEREYSFGTVVSKTSDQIILSEYDYENDKEVQVTYVIDPNTQIGNGMTLGDIKEGDVVDLEYKNADGKKVAVFIKKEEVVADEYYEPEQQGGGMEEMPQDEAPVEEMPTEEMPIEEMAPEGQQ